MCVLLIYTLPALLILDAQASGSAGSLALAVNWTANFCVGLGFLPLQNALSRGATDGQGNVFYVFAAITLTLLLVRSRTLHCLMKALDELTDTREGV